MEDPRRQRRNVVAEPAATNSSNDRVRWRIRKMNAMLDDWKAILQRVRLQDVVETADRRDSGSCQLFNYTDEDTVLMIRRDEEERLKCQLYAAEDEKTGQIHAFAVISAKGPNAYISGYYTRNSVLVPDILSEFIHAASLGFGLGKNIIVDFPSSALCAAPSVLKKREQFNESSWAVLGYFGHPAACWKDLPRAAASSSGLGGDQQQQQHLYVCHAQMLRVEDIASFDRTISGQNRAGWLRRLFGHSNELGIPRSVHLVVTDRAGRIRGCGCVCPGARAARIGPIYARDLQTFLLLFRNLMGSCEEARTRGVELAVCSANLRAIEVVENVLQLRPLPNGRRLLYYSKRHPRVAIGDVYCLSNCITQYV